MEATIELSLTHEEWCEVANAVESKIRLIERGDYGMGEEEGGNQKWVATLESALCKLGTALEVNGIGW